LHATKSFVSSPKVQPDSQPEADPPPPEQPVLSCTFRVLLHAVAVHRADGEEEDDFKTWAHAVVLTHGRPNGRLWYAGDEMLGRTSVSAQLLLTGRRGFVWAGKGRGEQGMRLAVGVHLVGSCSWGSARRA